MPYILQAKYPDGRVAYWPGGFDRDRAQRFRTKEEAESVMRSFLESRAAAHPNAPPLQMEVEWVRGESRLRSPGRVGQA